MKPRFENGIILFSLLLSLIIVSQSVHAATATNVTLLYGWNGTTWVPLKTSADGTLQSTLNLSQSFSIFPASDNAYDLGSASLRWRDFYVARNVYLATAGGSVGIGTAAPVKTLDVVGTINSTQAVTVGSANVSTGAPNLVLNSDFGRRNKWMTFMPETFADTSGITAQQGAIGSVASNIHTSGTAGASLYSEGLSTWRDVRFSCQFKLVQNSLSMNYACGKYVSGTWASVTGAFAVFTADTTNALRLVKWINGVGTQVATTAYTATLNNWYWLELETQGTTYIAKLYSSGANPIAKSSATLVATTITGTIGDSNFASGGYLGYGLDAGSTAGQWGGLSTGDGGVYVEGWGPESWDGSGGSYFLGTKGGQAIGFNDSADSGPIGKQWTLQAYIPQASRSIYMVYNSPQGTIVPNTNYIHSYYEKVSGKGGTGDLIRTRILTKTSGGGNTNVISTTDNGETSWTRLNSGVIASGASDENFTNEIYINFGLTATGTAFIDLPQLEQGSAMTPWRNAPADDGPIVWDLESTPPNPITISYSGAFVDIDSRDGYINIFLPWNANVELTAIWVGYNNVTNTDTRLRSIGVQSGPRVFFTSPAIASSNWPLDASWVGSLSAGKTRVGTQLYIAAGSITFSVENRLIVTATRGK